MLHHFATAPYYTLSHSQKQEVPSELRWDFFYSMDLEGFEPLTSRMRIERSPNSFAFVHTSHTVTKENSTYIRPYKTLCHPDGLLLEQV